MALHQILVLEASLVLSFVLIPVTVMVILLTVLVTVVVVVLQQTAVFVPMMNMLHQLDLVLVIMKLHTKVLKVL